MQLTWDVINVFWSAHFSVDEMMNKWSQHHFPVPNSYKLMNPHATYASRKTLSVAHPVLKHTGTLWSNLETRWKAPGHQLFYVIKSNVYTLSTYHFVNSHADHPGKKRKDSQSLPHHPSRELKWTKHAPSVKAPRKWYSPQNQQTPTNRKTRSYPLPCSSFFCLFVKFNFSIWVKVSYFKDKP